MVRGKSPSTIPQEIYTIPASSPVHHVTYVTVEEDNDDEWVTFAYVAAYTGMMIGWGCAVWGSGWYYPPYVGYGGFYPVYYPYPHTYGMGAWYNPYTGGYGRGVCACTDRTAASAWARRTTRAPERTRAARPPTAVRIARRRAGLQPAHRDLRADASGLERLRQLGHELRAARRQLGADGARAELPARHIDVGHPHDSGAGAVSRVGPGGERGRPSAARRAATSTPAATATSTAATTAEAGSRSNGSGGWSSAAQRARRERAGQLDS